MNNYPYEIFPIWHHPYQSLKSKCDYTNELLFKQMMKVFEPLTMTGIDSEPHGKFKSKNLEWIAKRYTFRTRKLVINVDYSANAYEVDLRDGVRLLIQFMNPQNGEFDESESFLYLVFLYLDKTHKKIACPFKEVNKFLDYLQKMPNSSIKRIFMRPLDVSSFPHFKKLPMIDRKVTTERLKNAYVRKFKASEMEFKDNNCIPYLEIPLK